MAIESFAEYFGCESAEIFEEKQQAEGYIAGTVIAAKMHEMIFTDYGDRSASFKENLLRALREQL